MNQPKPTDAKQLDAGNLVVLLVGDYDPASLDYARAAEALSERKGVDQVWLAPLANRARPEHVQNMCTMLALDVTASSGRQVGCCTVALSKRYDTPDELVRWCRNAYPDVLFRVARIDGNATADDTAVIFANEEGSVADARDVVSLREYLRQPADLRERIAAGRDASRSMPDPVWRYVQQYRLYREG